MFVSSTQAASLLGICPQRVRQLLKAGRIVGAKKVGRFWEIPLFGGIPVVTAGSRGPDGTWRKRLQEANTIIHVFKQQFESNKKYKTCEPVIIVRQGSRVTHCHEVDINGPSRLVYRPFQNTSFGAKLWIEAEPDVEVITRCFP
jgi:hypothetical protein